MKHSFIFIITLMSSLVIGYAIGDNGANNVYAVEVPAVPACCYINPLECEIDDLDKCPAEQVCGNFNEVCGTRPCCAGLSCHPTTHMCVPPMVASSSSSFSYNPPAFSSLPSTSSSSSSSIL